MQLSRNTKSQACDKSHTQAQSSPSPDRQVKKTRNNLVAVSNSQKKLAPSPKQEGMVNSFVSKIAIEEKSNSTEEIRIKGFEKLLYVKKCRQKNMTSLGIFQGYPFSCMDAWTFRHKTLRDENGQFKAQIIQDSEGIHLVQEYIQKPPESKYSSIEEEQGKFNGLSVSIFNDGSIFQGIYHAGHYCGNGYQLQSNGNTYIGTFKDGIKNGNGTYYWFSNNQIYSGEWHGGLPHGSGVYIGGDHRDRYEGMFSNGLKYGFGTQSFQNGDKYSGQYVNGVAQGYGEYFWQDGSIYKGDFKHGVRHGYGIWKDQKQIYQGHYRMDKKEGLGIYKWIGKQVYKGEFRDDFRDGYGEFYSISKTEKELLLYKGCWMQGKKWEEGKVDEKKLKELYTFLDQTHKLAQELDELSKKNEPKARVGHKNCIPHEFTSPVFKN